jgi:hypothetical protein
MALLNYPAGAASSFEPRFSMKRRRLPIYLIVRNVCLGLALLASALMLAADIHAAANQQAPQTLALRRLFVYQLMVNATQE